MLNILVMSSNAVLQKLTRKLIGRWLPSASLASAADFESALAGDADNRPDIILLDMSMLTSGNLKIIKGIEAANRNVSMIVLCRHPWQEYFDGTMPEYVSGCIDIASNSFVDDFYRCIVKIAKKKSVGRSLGVGGDHR